MRLDLIPAGVLVLFCVVVLVGQGSGRPVAPASSPDDDTKPIAAVLDGFHDAASKADPRAYFAHWTDESVFLGTDATERWVGPAFRDFARPYFEKGTGWTYRPRDRHISLDAPGNVAWFDELLDNDKYGECRGSGILAKRDGAWWILQYNLSIPIPNDMAAAETARIAEWKKTQGPAK